MKSVVVLSGGMDSLTALHNETLKGFPVLAINFQYGSKHNAKEAEAIKKIVERYKIPLKQITLNFNDYLKSDLLQNGGEIPEGHYAAENMKKTVIPFRNGIMLAMAAGFAESEGADSLVLGNHAGDHAIYPDCRLEFSEAMAKAIELGTYTKIKLETPFVKLTKAQIVKLGVEWGVDYSMAWSCYKGEEIACGRCGTCFERIEAFHEAGVEDPIAYQDREFWKTVVRPS